MNFVNSIITDIFIQKTALNPPLFNIENDIINIALFYSHPDQAGIIIKTTFLNDKTVLCLIKNITVR